MTSVSIYQDYKMTHFRRGLTGLKVANIASSNTSLKLFFKSKLKYLKLQTIPN